MPDFPITPLLGDPLFEKPAALILDEQDASGTKLEAFLEARGYAPLRIAPGETLAETADPRLANARLIVLSAAFPSFETPEKRREIFALFPMTPVILMGAADALPQTENPGAPVIAVGRNPEPDELARALDICNRFFDRFEEALERYLFLRHARYLEEPLARILHDLNNQITGLKGGSDLLNYAIAGVQDLDSQAKLKRYMDQFIQPSVAQIEHLVQVWRHLRQGRLKPPAAANLLEITRRGIRLAANPLQQKRIRLTVREQEIPIREAQETPAASPEQPEPIAVLVNGEHLALALACVVQNALEAVENRPDGQILVAIFSEDERFHGIEVHDNGPGIAEKDRALIWHAFHSTKGRNRNGLGLAIAKQVVDKYQGRIACLTSPLGGVCIRMLVPAASV